jgi:hypothetical protein
MGGGSSVDIVTGYRLDGRGVGTQVLSGSTFSLLHSVQTGPVDYPAFCAMATGLEADHSPPTYVEVKTTLLFILSTDPPRHEPALTTKQAVPSSLCVGLILLRAP